MIRNRLKEAVDRCFASGVAQQLWSDAGAGKYTVEVPKHENQGDYSTNIALVIGGIEKRNPREIGAQVAAMLEREDALVHSVSVAGPGFVNVTIRLSVWQQFIGEIEAAGSSFGTSDCGRGKRVMVEFVSANPTGPLSIGHGRQAILGGGHRPQRLPGVLLQRCRPADAGTR